MPPRTADEDAVKTLCKLLADGDCWVLRSPGKEHGMPKEFYTERDIEDLVKRGVLSLDVNDNCVLTDLAYEKANRLGMKLTGRDRTIRLVPLCGHTSLRKSSRDLPWQPPSRLRRPSLLRKATCQVASAAPSWPSLVAQVDPALLDSIIERVLKSTGLK